MKQDILKKIIGWVQDQPKIKAVLLTGSRAQKTQVDSFSDYDIALFSSATSFLKDDKWLDAIGKVWICIPEKIVFNRKVFPTRLVIFDKGIKVDFTFYSLDVLRSLIKNNTLTSEFDRGYQVLLDKEEITKCLKKPVYAGLKMKMPSEKEFVHLVEEFFFEALHVAKYLKREDLWLAKLREADLKLRILFKMIEWNEGAKHHWNSTTLPNGKNMSSWVEAKTWKNLHAIFAHFDSVDSWKALEATINVFCSLGRETAELLDYHYPKDLEKNIGKYIQTVKKH